MDVNVHGKFINGAQKVARRLVYGGDVVDVNVHGKFINGAQKVARRFTEGSWFYRRFNI